MPKGAHPEATVSQPSLAAHLVDAVHVLLVPLVVLCAIIGRN